MLNRHSRRLRRSIARFGRATRGAVAVEFGIVALPFLMLLFAVFEMATMIWSSQVLEQALSQTSRTLLTGQSLTVYAGTPAANATKFRDTVCANATTLIDCSKVTIDVRAYSNFAAAQSGTAGSNPVNGTTYDTSGFGFQQPAPGQIVVVRAALRYKLFLTSWSSGLANLGNGERAIVASTTFRAEPFSASGSS